MDTMKKVETQVFVADPTTFTVVDAPAPVEPEPELEPARPTNPMEMDDDQLMDYILTRALGWIDDPDRWTRGTFARTAMGASISVESEAAWRYCAVGAVQHATWEISQETNGTHKHTERVRLVGQQLLTKLEQWTHKQRSLSIPSVNDGESVGYGRSAISHLFHQVLDGIKERLNGNRS